MYRALYMMALATKTPSDSTSRVSPKLAMHQVSGCMTHFGLLKTPPTLWYKVLFCHIIYTYKGCISHNLGHFFVSKSLIQYRWFYKQLYNATKFRSKGRCRQRHNCLRNGSCVCYARTPRDALSGNLHTQLAFLWRDIGLFPDDTTNKTDGRNIYIEG